MGSGYINCNILKKTYSVFKSIVDDSLTEVTADMLNGATSISSYAFVSCDNLTSVEIPSSVEAFSNCSALTSIEIPNSVTSINYRTFSSCSALASITIPNSVTSIGDRAFQSCTSLTSIVIPSNVTWIGSSVFNSCSVLTSVTIEATAPPTLGTNVFNGTHADLVIYVPAGSVDAYKAATNWSTYASKIQAIPST